MKQFYTLLIATILLPCILKAEIYKVNLTGIKGCGGVTLIPSPLFTTSTYTGVTLYYEKLVAADTWQLEATQVFNPGHSYQIYNGSDLPQATTFRVRAIDAITGIQYTSNSVAVDPATWNVDRGTSPTTAFAYWGNTCDSISNYAAFSFNYTTYGRPPYNIEYKETTEDNYRSAGFFTSNAIIYGIRPFVYYNIRITDYCGKVINTSVYIDLVPQYNIDQDATTCNNGQLTISAPSDGRYSGIPPYTYGLVKYKPGANLDAFTYTSSNTFTNLSPGLYYYSIKDACGNVSPLSRSVALGASFPQCYAQTVAAPTDCQHSIQVYPTRGQRPFRFGFRNAADTAFTYQSDSVFTTYNNGQFYYQLISACGDTSATGSLFVSGGCALRSDTGRYESANKGGCPNLSGNQWIDIKDNTGSLVYAINPHNNTLNNACWGVRIVDNTAANARKDTVNGVPVYFLNRNFYIEPQPTPVLTDSVSVRLFFTNDELSRLLTAAAGATGNLPDKNTLRILKKKQAPGSPVDLDVTNDTAAPSSLFTVITPAIYPYQGNWYMEFKVGSFSELNTYFSNTIPVPLPVKWLSVQATANASGTVQLQWTTTEESNIDNYIIEHSTDGSAFTAIGTLPAQNTPGTQHYSFTHTTPVTGANYYRIKQADLDGHYTFSKIVTAGIAQPATSAAVSIFPNPATDQLSVEIPANTLFHTISIYDAEGRRLWQKQITNSASTISIDIHTLSAGWYLVQLDGPVPQKLRFIKKAGSH